MKTGLLLLNLGTPDSPDFMSVWRYLREFLADKRVISLPALLRYMLLYGVILPTRVAKTTHAYKTIWTDRGSPLRYHGEDLRAALQRHLGETYRVVLAMRYGRPSLDSALAEVQDCERLLILPLYPQYSSAATGSILEAILQRLGRQTFIPELTVLREFYQHPAFIQVLAQRIAPYILEQDMLVFSYHGLPERQIKQAGCHSICADDCTLTTQFLTRPNCYRAQCYQTSSLLAQALHLNSKQYTTVFQSRLGRIPWIQPYMEEHLKVLATQGMKRIAVVCPSFVADCLETIEEVGVRMRALWQDLGGESMVLVPCLNADDAWCQAILALLSIKTEENS